MASITLENVFTDFPIYGSQPSLRQAILNRTVGGLLRRSVDNKRVFVRALDNVSLQVTHGEQLGIVGHNGAGKSTLLRVLGGIYEPSHGRVTVEGRVSPLLASSSPGLEPDDSGYENIITCGLFLGMTRQEIARKMPDIDAFAELGDFLRLPVRTYSAGMQTRLAFAIATAIDPEILLLDEGIGAGDARFAAKAHERIEMLIGRSSIMVVTSHSDELIRQMCNRVILLDQGRILADGSPDDVLEQYRRMNTALAEGDSRSAVAPGRQCCDPLPSGREQPALASRAPQQPRAVFLDRDGVINRPLVKDRKPYAPRHVGEFRLLPGVVPAVAKLKAAGFLVIVVTNQPDVGHGLIAADTLEAMHGRLKEQLPIDAIMVCPHKQDDECECRKPKPGLIRRAVSDWGIEPARSYFVGDRWSDIAAGKAAGLYTVFVDRNYAETPPDRPDASVRSLGQAVPIILAREEARAEAKHDVE
jgi:homopolymeric O-antigen transport system ATP-binding protein